MPYKDKNQQREYQRQWKRANRQAYLQGKSCVTCGCGDATQLEVDHKNPDEKIDHRIWSWSKVRREAELAKCQVLCKTCHREKSKKDMYNMRGSWKVESLVPDGYTVKEVIKDEALIGNEVPF